MTTTVLLSPSDTRDLTRELETLGARAIHWPRLDIDGPSDYFALDDAIANVFGYDWLIVKNAAAAEYFLRRFEQDHEIHELDELKTLAIGEPAHQTLGQLQIHIDAMARRSTEVFATLESYVGKVTGLNLLLPSANITGEPLARQLEEAGARVDSVTAYRTCSSSDELSKLKALIAGGGIDSVAFTRPTDVDELATLFDTDDLRALLRGLRAAGLDDATSSTANIYGLSNLHVPAEPLVRVFARLVATPVD